MNPVQRLVTQAEVNLSAAGRRVVENATAPLKIKAQEFVSETLGTVATTARNLAIKAALGLFATVMLIVAVCYALSAAYQKLAVLLGPIEATMVMAGAFLLLAVVAIVILAVIPTGSKKKPEIASASVAETPAAVRPDQTARVADETKGSYAPIGGVGLGETEQTLQSGLDAVVAALGDAGFNREQAGLRAGLIIARQLRPMQAASLALLGGFLAGTRLVNSRRRRRDD